MIQVQISGDSRYMFDRRRCRSMVKEVLAKNGWDNLMVSIMVVGKRKMRQLNRDFHEVDAPTDVLSFPFTDPKSAREMDVQMVMPEGELDILGDLVVCYPICVQEAAERNVLVDEQVCFLVEHGLQHLMGKHHD